MGKAGKKNKKGKEKEKKKDNVGLNHNTPKITAESKEMINRLLKEFAESDDPVYTFKSDLNNKERAMVHLLCRKMDMTSKSTGKGNQRHVSVYKLKKESKTLREKKNINPPYQKKNVNSFSFLEDSKRFLMELFMYYPPGEDHIAEEKLSEQTGNRLKLKVRRDDVFMRPLMSKADIAREVKSLASKIRNNSGLREISRKRSQLPIASFQTEITSTVANHQVVLICGETGCGKTTQVPQYLLDYMWGKGEACKIVCTQPRRISAISVSERIAQERGDIIGQSVGYKIRLEAKGGKQSSILFCTSGVLLRILVSSKESPSDASNMKGKTCLSELTHIVVDEIHERDQYSDFMLTILRDLLPAYPHLRLVLMSATIDAEKFSQYLGGCPVIRVPGFTHPVKSFYLEDVISIVKTPERNHLNANTLSTCPCEEPILSKEYQVALDEAIEMSCSTEELDSLQELISSEGMLKMLNYQHSSTGVTPLMVFAGKGRGDDVCTLISLGANCHLQARDGSTALDWAQRGNQTEAAEIIKWHMAAASSGSVKEGNLLKKINPELIDYVLIEQLLRKVCMESKDGAILVFLPGWEEINRTQKAILAKSFFKTSSFLVLPLHSMVPAIEQKKVFQQPPKGCRKIILSTNIAETSVTIDDVVYVIDTGRMKEKGYDPHTNVSTLKSTWISKASAKQREGRAGRCQPGVCYHLFSKLKAVSLADFQEPEIKRMPIEELCLQVKMLNPNCKAEEFLKKTLDPPVLETVNNAIAVLQDIGALSPDEQLTEMGKKLGCLPVHPLTSRMLFLSMLLNCLDPALTLACVADYRDPFILPMLPQDKIKADVARAKLAALYGGRSDQLAIVAAFDCWTIAKKRGLESRFCSDYYVSKSVMSMLAGMRMQLYNELRRGGFLPDDVTNYNANARNPGIILSVLVAGSYPRVGIMRYPFKGAKCTFVETGSGKKAQLLSRSLVAKLSFDDLSNENDEGPVVVYDEITQGDAGLHIRKCTTIGPLPLLLLAKEMAVISENQKKQSKKKKKKKNEGETGNLENTSKPEESIMTSPDDDVLVLVDGWLKFKLKALEVAQIYCLRERLSAAILFKISNPRDFLPPPLYATMYAISCLMAVDGLSASLLPAMDPNVDLLTSLADITEETLASMKTIALADKSNEQEITNKTPIAHTSKTKGSTSDQSSVSDVEAVHAVQVVERLPPCQTKPSCPQPSVIGPAQKMTTSGPTSVNPSLVSVQAQAVSKKRKRKNKFKKPVVIVLEESQPAQGILPPPPERKPLLEPPLVQTTVSTKTKKKKKPRTNANQPAGAILLPVGSTALERPILLNPPSAPTLARPNVPWTGVLSNPPSAPTLARPNAQTGVLLNPPSVPALPRPNAQQTGVLLNPPSAPTLARPNAQTGISALIGSEPNHFGPYGPRGI